MLPMVVSYWNGTSANYPLTNDSQIGPFSEKSDQRLRTLTNAVKSISIDYRFRNRLYQSHQFGGVFASVDFLWSCEGLYDFSDDSVTLYRLRIASTVAPGSRVYVLEALDAVTIFFCTASILLAFRALNKSNKVYQYAKRRLEPVDSDASISWSKLTITDKLAFFNLWHVWTVIGDVSLIIASSAALANASAHKLQAHREITLEQLTRSLGVFFSIFSLIKYFEYNIEFYMLIVAVRTSVVRIVKFVITCAPFYISYALVGLFSFPTHEDLFGSVWQSCRTLFAVLNGDSILLVYQTLCQDGNYGYCGFAQLYLYTFCIIFIVVVLNVFIFIIETGYERAQRCTTKDDEQPIELDHDKLHRILDAADAAGGIHLDHSCRVVGGDDHHGSVNAVPHSPMPAHEDCRPFWAGGAAAVTDRNEPHDVVERRITAKVERAISQAMDKYTTELISRQLSVQQVPSNNSREARSTQNTNEQDTPGGSGSGPLHAPGSVAHDGSEAARLKERVSALTTENAALRTAHEQQRERIAMLEAQLHPTQEQGNGTSVQGHDTSLAKSPVYE
eukprot:m.750024 g.750024  ORF g.750024 m.750024 type:complete len:560 (-) comp23156_c0_seq10:339-2018(-)